MSHTHLLSVRPTDAPEVLNRYFLFYAEGVGGTSDLNQRDFTNRMRFNVLTRSPAPFCCRQISSDLFKKKLKHTVKSNFIG